VPASHYRAYQRVYSVYTQLERLYLLERVDKHGALAPLTVREVLGVVAVRADDATVCPIDYVDLAVPDLQPLRRCAAALWWKQVQKVPTTIYQRSRSRFNSTYERRYVRPQAGVHDALDGRNESRQRPPIVRGRCYVEQPEHHEHRRRETDKVKTKRFFRRRNVAALKRGCASREIAPDVGEPHTRAIVAQPVVAAVVEKDVARLYVAVQPAARVQKAQRRLDAANDACCITRVSGRRYTCERARVCRHENARSQLGGFSDTRTNVYGMRRVIREQNEPDGCEEHIVVQVLLDIEPQGALAFCSIHAARGYFQHARDIAFKSVKEKRQGCTRYHHVAVDDDI
jgi:hypothetical protein